MRSEGSRDEEREKPREVVQVGVHEKERDERAMCIRECGVTRVCPLYTGTSRASEKAECQVVILRYRLQMLIFLIII